MSTPAPEYVAARRVLLDALQALEPHLGSLVLVGAQAVYRHTGTVEGTGAPMTTDSDLALDVDVLADEPEMTTALGTARFLPVKHLPGQWENPQGIRVDLMAVPHQSAPPHGRRAAKLPPHGRELARLTPGLEPALIDNLTADIRALDPADDRRFPLRVAGPAALLTAKLIKIGERFADVQAGISRPSRLKEKDALDCYRLLVAVETHDLVDGFASHRRNEHALATSRTALTFFQEHHELGQEGVPRTLLARAMPGDDISLAAFDALSADLIDALGPDLGAGTARQP